MKLPKMTPGRAMALFAIGCVIAVLFGTFGLAYGQEVSSVRSSQHEWQCEDANGNKISGHTRQDKAFQSCINQALATGEAFTVRGGTFTVTADGVSSVPPVPPTPTPEPPVEPDPDPVPPDPAPPGFLVKFGPVTGLTEYPASIGALRQDAFRWEIKFTTAVTGFRQGLASRDQSGTIDSGHLSVWVDTNQTVIVRNQGTGLEPNVTIHSTHAVIVPGQEHTVTVSLSAEGLGLWVDGVFEGSSSVSYGLTGNNLPLVVGGLCTTCTADGLVGPKDALDGTTYMEIWNDPLPLPPPVANNGSAVLSWINPTEYVGVNGGPILPGELEAIRIIQVSPGSRNLLATVAADVTGYEAINLVAGVEHCFVARAVARGTPSDDSNQACKVP